MMMTPEERKYQRRVSYLKGVASRILERQNMYDVYDRDYRRKFEALEQYQEGELRELAELKQKRQSADMLVTEAINARKELQEIEPRESICLD